MCNNSYALTLFGKQGKGCDRAPTIFHRSHYVAARLGDGLFWQTHKCRGCAIPKRKRARAGRQCRTKDARSTGDDPMCYSAQCSNGAGCNEYEWWRQWNYCGHSSGHSKLHPPSSGWWRWWCEQWFLCKCWWGIRRGWRHGTFATVRCDTTDGHGFRSFELTLIRHNTSYTCGNYERSVVLRVCIDGEHCVQRDDAIFVHGEHVTQHYRYGFTKFNLLHISHSV